MSITFTFACTRRLRIAAATTLCFGLACRVNHSAQPVVAVEPTPEPARAVEEPTPSAQLKTAISVGAEWLNALGGSDREAMKRRSALPFEARGFTMPNPVHKPDCGKEDPPDYRVEVTASDPSRLEQVLACVITGSLLLGGTSPVRFFAAPEPLQGAAAGVVSSGELRLARPAQLPERLTEYRSTLESLPADHIPLVFFWTDDDGISVFGILVLAVGAPPPAVSKFLVDELFEE